MQSHDDAASPGTPIPDEKPLSTAPRAKSRRGFAAMDPELQKRLASRGGRAAHSKGTAHQWTADNARSAGSKGGRSAHARGTAHQWSAEEARAAGRRGGEATHRKRLAEQAPKK